MLGYIICIIVLSLSLVQLQSSAESRVSLTAEPGVISERLTDTLTLTCSLQDVPTSEDSKTSRNSSTSYDIELVSSIIVFRGSASAETPVARITGTNSTEAVADEENLQVTGDVNPARPSDPEFLKLVWTKPRQEQAGQYTCEVHALDKLGGVVVFKAKTNVKRGVPNIEELIAEIMNLKNTTIIQEQKINELLMKSVLRPPHTEQGVVECSSSAADSWRRFGLDKSRAISKTVLFKNPYVYVPVVSVSVVTVDVSHGHNTRYTIDVSEVNRTGFVITCSTWYTTFVYWLRVHWMSTGA